jgi:hypothetical protein
MRKAYFLVQQPNVDQGHLILRSLDHTPQSVEFLWAKDRPVAETMRKTEFCKSRLTDLQTLYTGVSTFLPVIGKFIDT